MRSAMSWLSSATLGAVVFTATLAGVFACTTTKSYYVDEPTEEGDGGGTVQPSADSGLGILTFRPEEAFSGFDGEHPYRVPVAVYDSADDLKVTAVDPSAADVVPTKLQHPERNDGTVDNGKYFLVTTKKAGKIALKATSKGRTVQASITVAQYDPARWRAGEARYKTGPDAANPPCTNCHVNGQAIDHSPAALATSTDQALGAVITSGISTANFPIRIDGKPGHRWSVSDNDVESLVVYLRGLEPRGFK
jgi:hypothetical protein